MTVGITAIVEECKFDVFTFAKTIIEHNLLIGRDSLSGEAPQLKLEPDCGYMPKI